MARHKTPSFILELELDLKPHQKRQLEKLLKIARQIYNALLKEALSRLHKVRHDRGYQKLLLQLKEAKKAGKDIAGIQGMLREIELSYGYSEYSLHAYAAKVKAYFHDAIGIDGVILTKLDGDARGGASLSVAAVTGKPIKFVGTGEKMEAIDPFHPARMADRILGMGDIVSLVERAQEQYDEEEARRLERKIRKNQFDFSDFYAQIQQIKKMGNIKDLASMIPGVGKALKDIDIDDDAFKGIEAIILSMTPYERTHPECLNTSRRQRIARGSGTDIAAVNRLIKQFDQTRKMMKMVTNPKMAQMMAKMPKR